MIAEKTIAERILVNVSIKRRKRMKSRKNRKRITSMKSSRSSESMRNMKIIIKIMKSIICKKNNRYYKMYESIEIMKSVPLEILQCIV